MSNTIIHNYYLSNKTDLLLVKPDGLHQVHLFRKRRQLEFTPGPQFFIIIYLLLLALSDTTGLFQLLSLGRTM